MNDEKKDENADNVTNLDDRRPAEPEEIKLDNFQICLIRQSKSINVLMAATDIPKPAKLKIYKFFFSIMDRPEAKSLYRTTDEIVAEFMKENPEANPPMLNDPMFAEIFEKDSGITITKLQLTGEDIPDSISPADMIDLSWLINFEG